MFGNVFEQLFAPGRKHTDDERNRLLVSRDEVGDASPGKGPIDLDSGVVVMHTNEDGARGGASGPEGPDNTAGTAGTAGTEGEAPG